MAYKRESLEELDVMNNYLMNRLATDPEVGESFGRLLIKGLLGLEVRSVKILAERVVIPDDPKKRGVRLDIEVDELDDKGLVAKIFDIEPHRGNDMDFPKAMRNRQAQIDKGLLKSGEKDFSKLPRLYIISITNFDPFGYNKMVYSVKNMCREVPDLCYNDGVEIFYFNTAGTEGGEKTLKNFLDYLEDSRSTNVNDPQTKEMETYVSHVKGHSGGDYMTVGDWVDSIVADAVADAVAEKDSALAEKDRQIAELLARLESVSGKSVKNDT